MCVDSIISQTSLATWVCWPDERCSANSVVATRKTIATLKVQAAREGVRKFILTRMLERGTDRSRWKSEHSRSQTEHSNPIQFGKTWQEACSRRIALTSRPCC